METGNLQEIITDYFKDYFDNIRFFEDKFILGMEGTRNGNTFNCVFPDLNNRSNYNFDLLHHYLENIKGDMVRAEESMVLENGK